MTRRRCTCHGRCARCRRGAFGALEATCTGKYSSQVTNGIGGTLDMPCSMYCNSADVAAWRTAAEDMFRKVRSAWNTTAKETAIPQVVIDYVTAFERDYCNATPEGQCVQYKLPEGSWYDITANLQASTAIARWMSRGACALELLEQVRGSTIPVEAPPKPPPPVIPPINLPALGSWILPAAAIGLVLLLRR